MGNVALGVTTDAADQKVPISSITGATDTINTIRNHGLCAGDPVTIVGDSDDMATAGFTMSGSSKESSIRLYVIATGLTDTAFKVSETLNGSAAGLTSVAAFDGFVNPDTRADAGTNITATVAAGVTTISVASGAALPDAPFVAIIGGNATDYPDEGFETVLVTAKNSNDLTVVRGFEGTKDQLHTKIASPNALNPQRKVWTRSLAPAACAMADFDALEKLIRSVSHTGHSHSSTSDAHNGRANTLRSVTGTGDELTTGSAHSLVAGDRFVFVEKTGGSNVRLGHTYYVTDVSGGATKIKFCAERLHSSENPYHASATATANITLATDITAGYIRRLTSGGGATRLLSVTDSLYPRLWGWGSNVGMFRDRVITATLHLRSVTDRAAQSMIHHTTICSPVDPASIKSNYQELVFKGVTSGTFTLDISDDDGAVVTTGAITFSSTDTTLATRIKNAINAAVPALTNVRVAKRPRLKNKAGAKVHPCIKVTFGNSMKGITAVNESIGGSITVSPPYFLLIPGQRSQVSERWARQGAQIALVSPAKVFFRPNFEFEKPYYSWTSFPKNGGTDGQQHAWDTWGDSASDDNSANARNEQKPWRRQWITMRDAIVTTGGASNARMVWCPADGFPAATIKRSYPTGYVDYLGFDYYVHEGSQTAARMNTRLSNHTGPGGLHTVASAKSIIACEFGFGWQASLKAERPRSGLAAADPDDATISESIMSSGSGGLSEPNTAAPASPATGRIALFQRWMQRVYSSHPAVVAALYWDRDLGGGADHRLETGSGTTELVTSFANEICKPKTRTAI